MHITWYNYQYQHQYRLKMIEAIWLMMFLVSYCVLLCTQASPGISLISFATAVRGWVLHRVQPMRTGNPLVDSVAEHQAANEQAYDMYLSTPRYFACAGLFFCWHQRTPAKIFPVTRWRVPLKPIFLAQFWHSSWCSWIVSRCIQMYPVFIQKFIPNHSNFGGSMAFAALVALLPRCFLRQSLTTSHCSLLKPVYANFQGMLWSRNAAKGAIIEMLFRVDLACFCTCLYFCERIRGKLVTVVRFWCCEFHNPRKMSRLIIICGPIVSILAGQTQSRGVIRLGDRTVRLRVRDSVILGFLGAFMRALLHTGRWE